MPNQKALTGAILPEGSGRPSVRRILRSASRSNHWLRAAVPEAIRPVPTMELRRTQSSVQPRQ